MKLPFFEVWEFHEDWDRVRRIAVCGTEEDARMMMSLCPKNSYRSWLRIEHYESVPDA